MELLLALEKKVVSLIELSRRLQEEIERSHAQNAELHEEHRRLQAHNERLQGQVETLERSLLSHGQRADEVVIERRNAQRSQAQIEQARVLVDDLIRNIDLVVERELIKAQEKRETPS